MEGGDALVHQQNLLPTVWFSNVFIFFILVMIPLGVT